MGSWSKSQSTMLSSMVRVTHTEVSMVPSFGRSKGSKNRGKSDLGDSDGLKPSLVVGWSGVCVGLKADIREQEGRREEPPPSRVSKSEESS